MAIAARGTPSDRADDASRSAFPENVPPAPRPHSGHRATFVLVVLIATGLLAYALTLATIERTWSGGATCPARENPSGDLLGEGAKLLDSDLFRSCRGRDAHYCAPPAQNRTCGFVG